jgi:hypothetical protein
MCCRNLLISRSRHENGFLHEKEIPFDERRFLDENHILDNVGTSFASAQQTQTRVRSRTFVLGRQARIMKNGWRRKKKEKIFFFLFLRATPVKGIGSLIPP